jgi:SAM-dependent methyltransferase
MWSPKCFLKFLTKGFLNLFSSIILTLTIAHWGSNNQNMPIKSESFHKDWEKNYAQGRRIARYPYSDVVSYVISNFNKMSQNKNRLKALELGCGTGNNLAFLAKEGFEAIGIDGSDSGCRLARDFLAKQKLDAQIIRGDFVSLPFDNNQFDFILDRESIAHNTKNNIFKIYAEVARCLKRGGRFLSVCFSLEYGSLKVDDGKKIEKNTYTDFISGPLEGLGIVHFFEKNEIIEGLSPFFEIESITQLRYAQVYPEERDLTAEFLISALKK